MLNSTVARPLPGRARCDPWPRPGRASATVTTSCSGLPGCPGQQLAPGPDRYRALIEAGSNPFRLLIGYLIGGSTMIFGDRRARLRGPAMEYLVSMTTHVPEGTPEQAVEDIRTAEAARSGQLAAQGHLLRLWRPPLQPGEWRSLGLFTAGDDTELETVLASMPLRVWRSDEVTPLSPHPNDPALTAGQPGQDYLTVFVTDIPAGTPGPVVEDAEAREAHRARILAGQGHLLRLWRLPGPSRVLGLWRASGPAELEAMLKSLPLDPWMTVQTTPLTPHPSDPALASGRP